MSCTAHTSTANLTGEKYGGGLIVSQTKPMITYKYLDLTPDCKFKSLLSGFVDENMTVGGESPDPFRGVKWVLSYLTPDNLLLKGDALDLSVLVTLHVWGEVVVDSKGVVRSQHARIIAYDKDDFYFVMLKHKKIDVQTAKSNITCGSEKFKKLLLQYTPHFSEDEIKQYLTQNPDPDTAYQLGVRVNLDICREIACRDPYKAFLYADSVDLMPRDDTREAACKDHESAYFYAVYIDKYPRDDTRAAACKNPFTACWYAVHVDKSPRQDTREVACQNPQAAYQYALEVDKGPRDDTRLAACGSPKSAYLYACDVDRGPRDETRSAACKDPYYAYKYACDVDKCPRDDTRSAACKDAQSAYLYAQDVDQAPRDDTRSAACGDPWGAFKYALEIDKAPHLQTYQAVARDRSFLESYIKHFGYP